MNALRPSFPTERIAREIVAGPDDIVFVSGSLVEGFGNENSDLDLFLIRHEGEATPDPRLVLATVGVEGAYVDYEVYNQANMARISGAINATDVTDFRTVWETSLDRIDLYCRTAVGEAAFNPEGLRLLQRQFDRKVAARLLQTWAGLRSVVKLQESRESFDAGRAQQSLIAAQAAAAYACDSYLASQGEAYPNLKWRYEKIARRFGRDSRLYRRIWRLKSPGARGVPAYIDDVASFCDEMGMAEYEAWGIDELLLSQSREAKLFAIGGRSILVENKAMAFEMGAPAVQAWRALRRPLTRPQLVERMAKRWQVSAEEAAHEVDGLLQAWRRYRLVRES
jgi:hypothetical protein